MSRTFFSLRRRRGFDSRHPAPLTIEATRLVSCLWLPKTSNCLSGSHLYFFHKPFSDAHFSHDTPRCSACYLALARCPRTREPGFAPSNRRASAVGDKTPGVDRWGPHIVGFSLPHLA